MCCKLIEEITIRKKRLTSLDPLPGTLTLTILCPPWHPYSYDCLPHPLNLMPSLTPLPYNGLHPLHP